MDAAAFFNVREVFRNSNFKTKPFSYSFFREKPAFRETQTLTVCVLEETQMKNLDWRRVIVGPAYEMGSNCNTRFFTRQVGPIELLYE